MSIDPRTYPISTPFGGAEENFNFINSIYFPLLRTESISKGRTGL